jgi:hypothetical protein
LHVDWLLAVSVVMMVVRHACECVVCSKKNMRLKLKQIVFLKLKSWSAFFFFVGSYLVPVLVQYRYWYCTR